MDAARKFAYRNILYSAMLEMRVPIPAGPGEGGSTSSASQWSRRQALADCLHNLAMYSALEFEGFRENSFWGDYKRFENQYPGGFPYRQQFEKDLAEFRAPG